MATFDRMLCKMADGSYTEAERKFIAKLSWADTVTIRPNPQIPYTNELRVKKGSFAQQMMIDIERFEDDDFIRYTADMITEDFKRSIGDAVLNNKVEIYDPNDINKPRSFVQYMKDAKDLVIDYILPTSKNEKKGKGERKFTGDSDVYYDTDGNIIKKKFWEFWK